MTKKQINPSKTAIIRQPYEAIMSKVDTSVHQMRILFRIFEQVQQFQRKGLQVDLFKDGYITIEIETNSLLPENSSGHNYTTIKAALKDLVGKVVEVPGKAEGTGNKRGEYITYTGLIASADYFSNNRRIRIDIKKELFPYYLELSKGYAKVNINEIFDAGSVYTIKLYQYISQWQDQKYKIIKLEEFYAWLNVSTTKKAAQIKRDILEPAKDYLSEKKTTLYFTYEDYYGTEGRGNKIVGFKIYIHHRTPLMIAEQAANFHDSQLSARDKVILGSLNSLLRNHFGFEDKHFPEVSSALAHPTLYPMIQEKLIELSGIIKSKTQPIGDLPAYTIKCIQSIYEESL
jgi:plasmid replication initiation protein